MLCYGGGGLVGLPAGLGWYPSSCMHAPSPSAPTPCPHPLHARHARAQGAPYDGWSILAVSSTGMAATGEGNWGQQGPGQGGHHNTSTVLAS